MATLYGIEMHRYPRTWSGESGHGDVYRVLRSGPTVYEGRGHRGESRRYEDTTTFDTTNAARLHVNRVVDRHRSRGDYDVAFEDRSFTAPDDADLNAAFIDRWTATVLGHAPVPLNRDLTPQPRQRVWVLAHGLVAERTLDHTAGVLFDELAKHPHVVDEASDRVIGQLERLPQLPALYTLPDQYPDADATSFHIGVHLIDHVAPECGHGSPACAACTLRTAELMRFYMSTHTVAQLDATFRCEIHDTSRRLAALASA